MAEGQAAPAQPMSDHAAALSVVNSWVDEPEKKEAPAPEPDKQPAPVPAAEAPTPEAKVETAETAEAIRRHKLKYRDEEIEVDETELKSGYLKGKDYTQKTQELAKQRTDLDSNIKAQVEPVVKQYQEHLKVLERAVWHVMAPQIKNTDWNRLAQEDPAGWAQQRQAVDNVNQVLNAIKAEQTRVDSEANAKTQTQLAQSIKDAVETLQRDVPGWGDEPYNKALATGVRLGMTREKASQIVDPSIVKALHFAAKYLELQDARPQVQKQVAEVPKVMKPGTAEKPDAKTEKWKESMTRLRKTGRDADAVEVAKLFV